jgi:hypothetical protein
MHFTTGVILPARITKKSGARQIRRKVDELLFRFSEEFELKPYITECVCIVESTTFYKKRHPRHGKVDPSCEICKGTGKERTTYNAFACFDWWEIGGGWDGELAPKKGRWSTLGGNCIEVRDLPDDYYFFSFVTPNKKWHEQWQFMKRNRSQEKEIALWNEHQKKMLKKYSRNLVVLVDCHR